MKPTQLSCFAFVTLLLVMALPAWAVPLTGLTSNGSLVRFDSTLSGGVTTVGTISGLSAGQEITDIAYRPANRKLYGIAYDSTANPNTIQLYAIDSATAVATPIGTAFQLTAGSGVGNNVTANGCFGFTFDPKLDQACIFVNGTGLTPSYQFRVNPTTGAQTGSAVNPGGSDFFPAMAASNYKAGATSTSFYVWDFNTNALGTFDSTTGTVTPLGSSGIALDAGLTSASQVGLDIDASGTAYFVGTSGGVSSLYKPDLTSGDLATHLVGNFGALIIRDIASTSVTHFKVSGFPSSVAVGASANVTVTALNSSDATVSGYAGNIHITTSDSAAIYPADPPLTNGIGTYSITFKTAGTHSISATDLVSSDVTGMQDGIVVFVPSVVSLDRASSAVSNASTVNWKLVFNGAVTGLSASNFTLTDPSNTGASIGTPTTANGGVTWTIPVTTGSEGTLTLNLSNSTGLSTELATTLPFTGQSYEIDKTLPQIIPGPNAFTPLEIYDTGLIDYRSQVTATDAHSVTLTQQPASGVLNAGINHITITATDAGGNQSQIGFDITVHSHAIATSVLYASNNSFAPGHGTSGGPPADALLSSFGAPAIDDTGAIAFVGNWKSATEGRGTGLFMDDTFLAKTGGDASTPVGASGAKWRSFADPVIDSGQLACLATVSGVPKPNMGVVVYATNAGVTAVARSGDTATADGATFKTFKSVAINRGKIGFLAQLTPGTGTSPRTSAANDLSLWYSDLSNPLVLVLREGQQVSGKTIKTLISFAPGNGSPGQGRGWLHPVNDSMRMLALCVFTDKSQGVIEIDPANAASPMILAQSDEMDDTGPFIPSATFARFSLPSANALGHHAFLGTLTVGEGGVLRENASAIFANLATGHYFSIARPTDSANSTGAVFSAFKDPVLADDGGLAFPAMIKGDAIKGFAANTLWWMPPSGSLRMLAQGGTDAGDLTGAKWKSFTSLAIATNRGPIFTASLIPGKGGVTGANATGVWACDFFGNPRLLFRTGDIVNGKTLKRFTVLNASVGSIGVTRSFNSSQHVVWRATFRENNAQAIMTSQIP